MKLRTFTLNLLLFVSTCAIAQTSNYALKFSAATQKVSIPTNSPIQFNGTGNFAIETWIMPTGGVGTAGVSGLISKFLSNTNKFGYSLELNSTYKIVFTLGNNTLNGVTSTSSSSIAVNKWTHVCATLESGQIKIYLNGKLDKTTAWVGGVTDSGTELTFGQRTGLTTTQFYGHLDEVRIWNTARTDAQVKANLMKELVGNETGLVAYYKMSNGTGATLTDNKTTALNPGTISSATWCASGCFAGPRQALIFDGTNDYVRFTTSPPYNNAAITLEAWIKTTSALATRHIVSWGSATGGYVAALSMNNGKLVFGIEAGGLTSVTGTKNINSGVWTHVAVVKNGTNVSLYVNGFLDVSGTLTSNPIVNSMQIGNLKKNNVQQATYFPGTIDEVRIWHSVRTEDQIRENMMRNLIGTESGLRAYYRMDQVNGTVLHNHSTYSYNGTLTNFSGTYWTTSTAFSTWIGGESSDWSTAANWSNGLPAATQNIGIYKWPLGNEANINSNITVNSLVISTTSNPTISAAISTSDALAITKNITLLAGSTNNFGSLNVNSANQVVIPENSKINITSEINNAGKLILKSGDTYTAQIKNNGTVKSVGSVVLRKAFKASSGWYYVSFPFNVTFSNIKVTSTQLTATTSSFKTATIPYNNIYVAKYNTQRRDQNGTVTASDSQNWDPVTSGTLSAKKGYAFRVMADIEIDFVGTPNADMFDTASKNTTLETFSTNPSPTQHSWNLTGLPYTSAFNLDNLSQGTFYYIFNQSTQNYDVVENGDAYNLNSFGAFFVQASNPTLTFNTAGRSLKAPASNKSSFDEIQLSLSDNVKTDYTRIRLTQDASTDYETEKDALKMFSPNESVPQIWSRTSDTDLSINELPLNSTEIPIITKTHTEGNYVISLTNKEKVANLKTILLVDNLTGIQTDLLNEDSYMFYNNAGITSNRFKIVFNSDLSTNTDVIKGNDIQITLANKVATINGLRENATVRIIDATGKTVQIIKNIKNNENISLSSLNGIYFMHIYTATQESKIKIMCR